MSVFVWFSLILICGLLTRNVLADVADLLREKSLVLLLVLVLVFSAAVLVLEIVFPSMRAFASQRAGSLGDRFPPGRSRTTTDAKGASKSNVNPKVLSAQT